MPVNVISGRVVLKETGVGIPDLLVVVHDFDPGTVSEDFERPADGGGGGGIGIAPPPLQRSLGDRLGSRLTDRTGAFHFSFEDEEFRIRNAKEKRPDLHLVVLAPEEPGADPASRVLFTSPEIRQDAGRTEQYLVRLPGEILGPAGVPIPLDPAVAGQQAKAAVGKLAQASAWRAELVEETRKLATARVTDARERARRTDDVVERRLVESLAGMTAEQAERLNVVLPGRPTDEVVRASVERRIAKVNAQPAVTGYLVLSRADAERYRENGEWRTNITAAEIEPHLYRAGGEGGRPTTVTRNDPVEAMCRAASKADPLVDAGTPGAPGGTGGPSGGANLDAEVTALDLPRFVGRLLNGMTSPDQPGGNGHANGNGRPDASDVQQSVAGLRLASGPADVTAFHDYHNLQIAFDYVWKQLLDVDVLETGKALARTIADHGGDPLAALAGSGDPIAAMKRETQYIARTNDPFGKQLPDWVGGLSIDGGGTLGGTGHPGIDGEAGGGTGGGGGGGGGNGGGRGGSAGGALGFGLGGTVGQRAEIADPGPRSPHELLGELEGMLNEQYKFEVFAPGSTNFGLLVTYRQKWQPITYQAGDLVHTVTLAPRETRKVTNRRTVRRERSSKETETNLRNRADESKSTMRADAEVVERASSKSNFNSTAKGAFQVGVYSGEGTMTIDRSAEAASQETKKSFHESVMSAAMQVRSEKSWSFESKDVFEDETTDSSELTNPNEELTLTCLFYELERRFRVTEHLHKLTPVVLVAMEVPNPGRQPIDRILLAHSWIINRVLLDDRYRAPLEYLCSRIVGEELGLAQMARNVAEVRAAVEQLKRTHRDTEATLNKREHLLTIATEDRASRVAKEKTEGRIEKSLEKVFGANDRDDLESARMLEDMSREAYERAVRDDKDIRLRLDAETAALSAANQEYAKAYAEHMNRRMEVGGLRAHFKENVLYYMQAIWSFTFRDQMFFSLCNITVPVLTVSSKTYAVAEALNPPLSVAAGPDRVVLEVTADLALEPTVSLGGDPVTLAQIADLDQPLGFKGNYMIFPLRASNPLTDRMMLPYVDSELGLHDPDELGAWAPDDFARYARCLLKAHRQREDLSAAEFDELVARLRDQHARILSSPRRVSDEIIVPTDSLFIEALPGTHPLLEDFKLAHRMMDVEKVREETRRMKLESLRYAARILDDTLDDPDIERQIVINGGNGVVVPGDQ